MANFVSARRESNSTLFAVNAPFEILALIFEFACYWDEPKIPLPSSDSRGQRFIHPHDTRQAISITCFQWRQTATRVSSLWNHIMLAEYPRNLRRTGFDFLSTEIERSAGRLLFLHIAMDLSIVDRFNSFVTSPLVATKLGGLNLDCRPLRGAVQPYFVPLSVVSVFRQGHWPNLRSLRVCLSNLYTTNEDFESEANVLDLTRTPSLVDLQLSCDLYVSISLIVVPPSRCSIRHLHILHQIELSSIKCILDACSHSLEVFIWDSRLGTQEHGHDTITIPALPRLHTLRLDGAQALRHIINIHSCAPNVTQLHLGQLESGFYSDTARELRHQSDVLQLPFLSLYPKLECLDQRLPFFPFQELMKGRRNLRDMRIRGLDHITMGSSGVRIDTAGLSHERPGTVTEMVAATSDGDVLELESLQSLHMTVPLVMNAPAPTIDLTRIESMMEARRLAIVENHELDRGFVLILADHDRLTGVSQVGELYRLAKKYKGRFRIEFKEHAVDLGG